jgi:hypothetical protein
MNLRCDYTLISRTILSKNTVTHEQGLNNCSGNSLFLKLYWAKKVWTIAYAVFYFKTMNAQDPTIIYLTDQIMSTKYQSSSKVPMKGAH